MTARSDTVRPLRGIKVGISISEPAGARDLGFGTREVNRTTIEFAEALLSMGAQVCFGHDWREDGVMETVYGIAQRYHGSGNAEPVMVNFLPWPEKPAISREELAEVKEVLEVRSIGLPEEIAAKFRKEPWSFGERPRSSPVFPFLNAIALTYMRYMMIRHVDAMICIGGRTTGFGGWYPGIVEEAWLALQEKRLYISTAMGGASAMVADALRSRAQWSEFEHRADLKDAWRRGLEQAEPLQFPYPYLSARHLQERISAIGLEGLARENMLTADENIRMCETSAVQEVIQLVLIGLGRYSRHSNG